jgi:hypothetical protein
MKSVLLSMMIIAAVQAASLSLAQSEAPSDADQTIGQPSAWNQFWQGVADDWKKIGKEAKESGTLAGRTIKDEFKEFPKNFRKGVEDAKEDFKNSIGSPEETRMENGK